MLTDTPRPRGAWAVYLRGEPLTLIGVADTHGAAEALIADHLARDNPGEGLADRDDYTVRPTRLYLGTPAGPGWLVLSDDASRGGTVLAELATREEAERYLAGGAPRNRHWRLIRCAPEGGAA